MLLLLLLQRTYTCHLTSFWDVKKTIWNPIQLPTTPIAEYALMNISGRNSYLAPKNNSWKREQYAIKGIATTI